MGHFLNFGAGPNQLPPPWQNLTAQHDIRKPLRFEQSSTSFILAEHVIEHAPFSQGFGFLDECRRILKPGGVLRLAFPDVARFLFESPDRWLWSPMAAVYADELERGPNGALVRNVEPRERSRAAATLLLVGWNHESCWTRAGAAGVLLSLGYSRVTSVRFRESEHAELAGVDGHHRDVGMALAEMETTVLEATK